MWNMVRQALVVLWAGSVVSAFAADPLPGMWAFEGELTGKPGRGFQIDTQGGQQLLLSYFGYRTDGAALFLQASGTRAQDGSFEADLVEYRGGTVLGGPHQDGEAAQVVGRVQASFESSTRGSITLPGEAPRRVQRFQYENHAARFNYSFQAKLHSVQWVGGTSASLAMTAVDGVFTMRQTTYISDASGQQTPRICMHNGVYELSGNGIRSEGTVVCDGLATQTYRADDLVVDKQGFYSGTFQYGNGQTALHRGECIRPGAVFLGLPRCQL